jgi:hypothetical protein
MGTGQLLTLTGHTEVDAVAQRTTSWNRHELWRAGELIKTELEPFTLQWYGLSEFSAMLREAGFHHVTIHADYQTGQHPGTGKQDVDIRSHTRLRASAPGPRHPPARPRCARLPAPAGPSPRRTGRHLLPSRFGRRRDPSRPRTRLQPRRSARHTGESTSGGIDDLTSGRTGAQNWMICIRGQAQTARLETAYIRRSVIVRADYDMPLVTVRDRDERCRSVNRKSSSCSLGSPPGIAVSAGLRLVNR